jgi:hypothetical protein
MIYTCYEMIRDCREGREAGWSYLVSNYVPVIQRIVAHYRPELVGDSTLQRILATLRDPEASLFQSQEPAPERWFVAEMRQRVLAALDEIQASPEDALTVDLPLLGEALEPLTVIEKQAVWLETMRYDSSETAALLRMEARTIEKIRDRGAEFLRGKLDTWKRTLLTENGRVLGKLAAGALTDACPPPKAFLNVLDGRSTWGQREELEGHVTACWHCVDHFCRMAEVVELVRGVEPLPVDEAQKYFAAVGIQPRKKGVWQRWTASR